MISLSGFTSTAPAGSSIWAAVQLDAMIEKNGAIVIANDNCLVRPATAWQRSVEDIQYRYLPPELAPADPLPGRRDKRR
ncbi:hypothetical protein [Nocardia nepalensis]|uniref:hypothetical protein n=1 Tax=Nocardia nepalensis TaxID=3375448 RepID=UPI003B66D991